MRFVFTSLAVVAAATLALAQPRARAGDRPHFNPTALDMQKAASSRTTAPAPAAVEPATNGKRFAANLPPLSPKKHRRRPNRGGPHGGTPVRAAARAATSPLPPVTVTCNILASLTDGTPVGYISPVWNSFGEYGATQSDPSGALQVSITYSPSSPNQLDLTASNSPNSTYPLVGAVVGFASSDDNFIAGSYNYAYLAGTPQSAPGSPPFVNGGNSFSDPTGIPEDTESAIWSYNPETQAITAQWINTDGSMPATHIVQTQGVLAITGDVTAFTDTFGPPVNEYLFTCVSPVVSSAQEI